MSSTSALNSLLSSSSSSANASSINLSSLLTAATGATSTGIDVQSAVDAAIYAAQAPERQWQSEQANVQAQITALTSIQTAATSLSADLVKLTDPLGVLATRTVSSSNSSAVTATGSVGSAIGTHSVNVSQLATATSWYSPVLASAAATMGSSSLSITQANGSTTTFALSASGNSNLSSLVQSINAAAIGVNASIVQDASGARLALVGSSTGAKASFSVSDDTSAASTWSSASLASASATLSSSSFQVSDGSASTTLNINAGTTLNELADQINATGMHLSASVVTNSAGAHLEVSATQDNQITFSSDPTLSLTQANQAQDALLSVDGVPVSSASNTVSGALNGVTLSLLGTTSNSAPATLTISANSSQITSAISQFVTDYNSALSLVSTQFTFNASTGTQGVLASDATLRSLQSVLLSSVSTGASPGSSGGVASLADLGITMQDDGTLQVDTATLNQAVAGNLSNVQTFLQGAASNGFANQMQSQVAVYTNVSTGTLAVDVRNLTQQYNELQTDVNNFESAYISPQRTLLTSMYSKAEIALQSLPNTMKQIQAELSNSGS